MIVTATRPGGIEPHTPIITEPLISLFADQATRRSLELRCLRVRFTVIQA